MRPPAGGLMLFGDRPVLLDAISGSQGIGIASEPGPSGWP
jgi:hypothetical protein